MKVHQKAILYRRWARRLARHVRGLSNYTDQPLERDCWCGTAVCMNSVACQETKALLMDFAKADQRAEAKSATP